MKLFGHDGAHERLSAVFAALADPTRRAILARLAEGEATVTALTAMFDISQPAVSKHLKALERAGLISRSRDAQRRPCRLEGDPLGEASAWLERYRRFWEARFEQLDGLLEEMQAETQTKARAKTQTKARAKARTKARAKARATTRATTKAKTKTKKQSKTRAQTQTKARSKARATTRAKKQAKQQAEQHAAPRGRERTQG